MTLISQTFLMTFLMIAKRICLISFIYVFIIQAICFETTSFRLRLQFNKNPLKFMTQLLYLNIFIFRKLRSYFQLQMIFLRCLQKYFLIVFLIQILDQNFFILQARVQETTNFVYLLSFEDINTITNKCSFLLIL